MTMKGCEVFLKFEFIKNILHNLPIILFFRRGKIESCIFVWTIINCVTVSRLSSAILVFDERI